MSTIFNLGSINIDHVYLTPHIVAPGETLGSREYHHVLGGKGANQSIALARAGARVCHIGALNADHENIVQDLSNEGIQTDGILRSQLATGHAIIQVSDDGENAIVLFAGANHDISPAQLKESLSKANSGDWFLTQNETNDVGQAIKTAKAMGLKVAFNPAPMDDTVADISPMLIDLLIVNEIEAMQLSGTSTIEEAEKFFLSEWDDTEVIVTQGSGGVAHLFSGVRTFVEAVKVEVKDTTAAGDTFVGYYLAQRSQLVSTKDALKTACKAAGLTVTRLGASSAIPTQSEVEKFASFNHE